MSDTERPDVSVIVPVFNGESTLAEQLEALLAQRWHRPWELLVVDNASTDRTPDIAEEFAERSSRVRVVNAPHAHNLSYVRNAGVSQSRGRSVAFCDADDIVGESWLEGIGEALTSHALVGSCLEYERLNDMTNSGASRFGHAGLGSMFGYPVVSGAGLGCHRTLWDALGGNNESWDATGEDFEFSMRAVRDASVEPFFAERAVYHYRLRDGARAMFRQNRRYGRSHVRLFKEFGSQRDRPAMWPALRLSAALLWNIGDLRNDDRRMAWARSAGRRIGRLEGSVIYRTLYL